MICTSALSRSAGGAFTKMVDLGGVPSASAKGLKVSQDSFGKNNKIKAVLFDFHLVSNSRNKSSTAATPPEKKSWLEMSQSSSSPSSSSSKIIPTSAVTPDVSAVEQFASLLNVKLGSSTAANRPQERERENEDSLFTQMMRGTGLSNNSIIKEGLKKTGVKEYDDRNEDGYAAGRLSLSKKEFSTTKMQTTATAEDIRAKYAQALRSKGVSLSGVASITTDKEQQADKGDAKIHAGARNLASQMDAIFRDDGNNGGRISSAGSWLPSAGMGSLFEYCSGRSMKIGLVCARENYVEEETREEMERYRTQLSSINFQYLGLHPSKKDDEIITDALASFRLANSGAFADLQAKEVMVVSDRDDLLKSARTAGAFIVRVRPVNGRRGEITAHFVVPQIEEVAQVIDSICGVSFNNARAMNSRNIDHGGV